VRNATDVLLRMLDEAVDFSRLQTGALQLGKDEFVLLDVIERARQELAVGVAPLKFEAHVDDNVPPRLLGDANRLKAAVAALVRSAAKFRSATSYVLRVGAEPAADNELILHLALGDLGRPFNAQRSFEAGGGKVLTFEGFVEHGFCGSGLGLPVTAGIAELWGGRLSMAEDASSPVLFHVTARFALPSSKNKNDLLAAVEQQLDAEPPPARVLHILLIEDSAANRRFYTSALEQRGHKVVAVANGQEALHVVQANGDVHSFDLVLIDLEMPLMDGWQTAAALHEFDTSRARPVPMVALTADRTDGNAEIAESGLFQAAVTKAGELAHFYSVVEGVTQNQVPPGRPAKRVVTEQQRLDLNGTLKRLGGSEALFQDLVRFFLEDAPVVLAELGTALKRDDIQTAERAAHSLKGLVANFGAREATRLATELQRLGHEGALDGAVPLYQRLETEVNLLRRELEAYQAQAATR
jgi:CheY-like chemotaxis protein